MNRPLATCLFFAVVCLTANCEAQGLRGLFRNSRSQHNSIQQTPRFHQPQALSRHTSNHQLSNYRNPTISRILDGPTDLSRRNPAEVESRYIGGIHRSHFDNIGIPSGDIGLRGNALFWQPW